MKKIVFFFAISALFMSLTVKSQDVPPEGTPFLTMIVQPNSTISFDLGRAGGNGRIWIDPGDGNYIPKDVTQNWYGIISVQAIGDVVKIYGSLRNFEVLNQNVVHFDVSQMDQLRYLDVEGNGITELDVSQNYALEKLYFNYNQVSTMDLSHVSSLLRLYARQNRLTQLLVSENATSLELIYCDGNLLGACALDSLYTSLPIASTNPYIVLEVLGDGDNPGNSTSNTDIAVEKGWQVMKWVSSGTFREIIGDGSGCIEAIQDFDNNVDLTVYPNPAFSDINIHCSELIKDVELINIMGQVVGEYCNFNRHEVQIHCDKYNSGMYILKIYTSNGSSYFKKITIQ